MSSRLAALLSVPALVLFSFQPGCRDLPGTPRSQGAVIGGVAGAAAGALIARENRLLGALIGAAVGAGGGYLIGVAVDKADADEDDREEAVEAARKATEDPATVEDVRGAETGDLNRDGFVTMDEVIAMDRAGLTDDEILERLRMTGQVFELTPRQVEFLEDQGVSDRVIREMQELNQEAKERILEQRNEVIGREPR